MNRLLGNSLKEDKVRMLRLKPICQVEPGDSIAQTVETMTRQRVGCALVCEGPALVGIFTEHDFLMRVLAPRLATSRPVRDVMSANPGLVSADASVRDAIELMEKGAYRHLPVMENDGPIAVLSMKAIIHYLIEFFPATVYNLPPNPDLATAAREGA